MDLGLGKEGKKNTISWVGSERFKAAPSSLELFVILVLSSSLCLLA